MKLASGRSNKILQYSNIHVYNVLSSGTIWLMHKCVQLKYLIFQWPATYRERFDVFVIGAAEDDILDEDLGKQVTQVRNLFIVIELPEVQMTYVVYRFSV